MKERRLLFLLVLFFTTEILFAAGNGDSLFYKRMEGNIGKNVHVTQHIIRVFDNVSGNYFYTFEGEDGEKLYGKTIDLNGVILNDSTVLLKELGKDDYSFEGILDDDRFTGVWHDPADENHSIPFEFKEYYPNGSIPFDIHYLKSEHLVDDHNPQSPSANIELVLAWPEPDYFMPEILDSVKTHVLLSFFGDNFAETFPDTMLTHFEAEYYRNFEKQAGQLFEKYHKVFNWEKMVSMSVLFNSNYLLTLEYLRYAYSGGAHGLTNTSYDVINLRDGSLVKYESVFKDNASSLLKKLLTLQLKKDYSISGERTLKEAGFFYDSIAPNRNIYVNGNGVGFVYNSYEIAPFSQGTISVFLPFGLIKGIIKKGTPVYPLSQNR